METRTRGNASGRTSSRDSSKSSSRNSSGRTSRKKKKKSSSNKALIALLAVLTCLVSVLGVLYYFTIYRENQRQEIIQASTFLDGVTVNGVDISGLSMEQAKATLAGSAEAEIAQGVYFEFLCEGKSYRADSSHFTIDYTTDEVLSEAMGLAREGDYEAIMAEVEDIAANGRAYTIDYTVEPTGIESFIHSFADQVTIAPTPATFAVKPLEIDSDTKAQDAVDIGPAEDAENVDLRDLRFEFTEAVDGYGVDVDALMQEAQARCESKSFGSINVQFTNIPSDVTIATLKEGLVLRSSATTSYRSTRSNKNRVFNLKKACGLVYGTTLQPGEEFSANTILGDRTDKLGWLPAPAIIGGGSDTEDQPGGGVCQISTTAYQAVLMGDLEVVYRRGHSTKSGYADGGLDCTINTGTIDFLWKNNTQNPVYVFTWVNTDDYTVHCEIYGDPLPPEYDQIVLSSELVETIAPTADEYEVNNSLYSPYWYLKKDAKEGYKYTAYASYMKDGVEVKKVEIDTTTYRMHARTYYVWPGYDGSPLLYENQLTATEEGSLVLANPAPVDDSMVQ